jgi:lipoate-protein ligase A
MQKMAAGLSQNLNQIVSVNGITDLCINNQKFSGNAQRRLKKSLLFHGTLLYNFDLSLIAKYLPYPTRSPDYRNHRDHHTFITQLSTTTETQLIQALRKIWSV